MTLVVLVFTSIQKFLLWLTFINQVLQSLLSLQHSGCCFLFFRPVYSSHTVDFRHAFFVQPEGVVEVRQPWLFPLSSVMRFLPRSLMVSLVLCSCLMFWISLRSSSCSPMPSRKGISSSMKHRCSCHSTSSNLWKVVDWEDCISSASIGDEVELSVSSTGSHFG